MINLHSPSDSHNSPIPNVIESIDEHDGSMLGSQLGHWSGSRGSKHMSSHVIAGRCVGSVLAVG